MKQRDRNTSASDDFSSIFVISFDGNHVLKDARVEARACGDSNAGDETVVWDTDFGGGLPARKRTASESSMPPARCPWTVM